MKILSSLLLAFLLPALAQAQVYEDDERYAYEVVPWTETLIDETTQRQILETTLEVFQHKLADMVEKGILPNEIATMEDIEKLRSSKRDVGTVINKLNEWIADARKKSPSVIRSTDTLPDAFMVFGGGKFSANLGMGGGASAIFGLVVMPVHVTQIDKITQEVVASFYSVRVAAVGWGNADVGPGAGAAFRTRLGLGLLWNTNNMFTRPEQFVGVGVGLSGNAMIGPMGLNLKAGILNNFSLPDWVDFFFASAAWEMGIGATVEPARLNGIVILPFKSVVEAFNEEKAAELEKEIQEMERDLADELSSVTRITIEPSN